MVLVLAFFETNVTPLERQNLTSPHAGIKRADHDWAQVSMPPIVTRIE
jgi:hypothetical protein